MFGGEALLESIHGRLSASFKSSLMSMAPTWILRD